MREVYTPGMWRCAARRVLAQLLQLALVLSLPAPFALAPLAGRKQVEVVNEHPSDP